MADWWSGLPFLEQVFYYCAIPSTVILVIQTIMTIFGIGHIGNDMDFDGDVDFDSNVDADGNFDFDGDTASVDTLESVASLRFFSVRGIVAFFSLFGWVGVVLADNGLNAVVVFIIATISGATGMILIGLLFYWITRLQCNGNIRIKNAIGEIGEVYLPIPPNQSGKGKVQVNVQETLSEMYAMTSDNSILPTGTIVRVVDVIDSNILLVEKQG